MIRSKECSGSGPRDPGHCRIAVARGQLSGCADLFVGWQGGTGVLTFKLRRSIPGLQRILRWSAEADLADRLDVVHRRDRIIDIGTQKTRDMRIVRAAPLWLDSSCSGLAPPVQG